LEEDSQARPLDANVPWVGRVILEKRAEISPFR